MSFLDRSAAKKKFKRRKQPEVEGEAGREASLLEAGAAVYKPLPNEVWLKASSREAALKERLAAAGHEPCRQPKCAAAPGGRKGVLRSGPDRMACPVMTPEEVQRITVPYSDIARLREVMEKYGVVVVTEVLTPAECDVLEEMWKSDLLTLAGDSVRDPQLPEAVRNAYRRVEREGVAAWPVSTLFYDKFTDRRGLQQGCYAWSARTHPKVKGSYAAYYQQLGMITSHDELCTGMDTVFFAPAQKPPIPNDRNWMHVDYNSSLPDAHPCLQGLLYVWGAEGEDKATTVVWPGSHKEVFERLSKDPGAQACKGNFVPYSKVADPQLRKELMEGSQKHSRRVPVPQGSLLLWHSHTSHQGWAGGQRLANPVCWEPKSLRSQEAYHRKLWLAATGMPSKHWASLGWLHLGPGRPLVTETSEVPMEQQEPEVEFPLYPGLVPYAVRPDKVQEWQRLVPRIYNNTASRSCHYFSDPTLVLHLLKQEVLDVL